MAGHSKWAQIKHKKAGTDAKRGALFSKLARVITVAAREGGADPKTNSKLRSAMEQARAAGLPKDNVERAIMRGSGGGDEANLKAVEYEAYGPGGSAFIVEGLTDNTNRTTNEIKHILSEHQGRLAETGSVAWLFDRRITAEIKKNGAADEIELALIDGGAEDTEMLEDRVRAVVIPERWEAFRVSMSKSGLEILEYQRVAIPKNPVAPSASQQKSIAALVEELEDHADINEVWSNVEIVEPRAESIAPLIFGT